MPNARVPLPKFDVAYVISDLHIGGEPGFQMFSAKDQFVVFIRRILDELKQLRKKKNTARLLLVINGDFVDFLAERGARVFNLARASEMLSEIFARDEFAPVIKALQAFVAVEGTHLSITLGNHDLELALPETRYALLQLITGKKPERERQVELCFDGWGYRFEVNGRRALCLHGNEADSYNFTRYDELDRIIHDLQLFDESDFGAKWCPSAGTWFVINAVNPIKAEHPFFDLLKPELPLAATVLGVLDPPSVRYMEEVGKIQARSMANEFARPKSQRRMLSATTVAAAVAVSGHDSELRSSADADEIMERTERALAAGTIDDLIRTGTDVQFLGMQDWLESIKSAVAGLSGRIASAAVATGKDLRSAAQTVQCEALRKAVSRLVSDDPYREGLLEDADLAVEQCVRGDYDVVFAGHTHLRKLAARPNRSGVHVNTGTWAGLIGLTLRQVRGNGFEAIYEAFASQNRQKLFEAHLVREESTFARMFPTGADGVTVELGGIVKDGARWKLESVLNATVKSS